MTTDGSGAGARIPTDQQLADMLRFVARTCLEVERGLRPPAHLAPLLHPAEQFLQPGQLGRFRAGPVRDDHIGQPQVSRLSDTRAIGTVVTRTEGDHWGALSLELRLWRGRWRVAGLQRLLAAAQYRTPPARANPDAPTPTLLANLAEAARMARAAHDATSRRLAELPPGTPGYRAALDLDRYWQRTLRQLDQQLADFKMRDQTVYPLERVARR